MRGKLCLPHYYLSPRFSYLLPSLNNDSSFNFQKYTKEWNKSLMRFSWSSLKIKGLYLDEEEEIAFLFAQIILSMHHIHSNSILHRDLKAQNIFLTRSRNFVKVNQGPLKQIALNGPDFKKVEVCSIPQLCIVLCIKAKNDHFYEGRKERRRHIYILFLLRPFAPEVPG